METQTKVLMQMASTGTIPYISRKKFEELSKSVICMILDAEKIDDFIKKI